MTSGRGLDSTKAGVGGGVGFGVGVGVPAGAQAALRSLAMTPLDSVARRSKN